MPSTTTPSGRSLHRPSSGYLVTWGYRATRLRTTYASVHSITTQWTSRRRWSSARPETSIATSSSGNGRRSGPTPTPDPTTEPWSRPSAWLGSSVTRTGGKKWPSTDSYSDTDTSTTSFISGADTLPETATGVASRKPSAISFWSALPRWASRTTSRGNAHATNGLSTCAAHSVSLAAWTSCTSGWLSLEDVCETVHNQDQDQDQRTAMNIEQHHYCI